MTTYLGCENTAAAFFPNNDGFIEYIESRAGGRYESMFMFMFFFNGIFLSNSMKKKENIINTEWDN